MNVSLAKQFLKAFTPEELAEQLAYTTRENVRLKDRVKALEVENFWLARPVLKDHEIAQTVTTLRNIAVEFHAAQQLRERIAHVIVPILKGPP